MSKAIEFLIEEGDIRYVEVDVVVLKYAQKFYGVDRAVSAALNEKGVPYKDITPKEGEIVYLDTNQSIRSPHVLFVGVPSLWKFGYQEIHEFTINALNSLSRIAPNTKHLAMTIHGVNYGLDESESLLAQFAGCFDAIQKEKAPIKLERISIIESDPNRVNRLRHGFETNIADIKNVSRTKGRWAYRLEVPTRFRSSDKSFIGTSLIEGAGIKSDSKPHVFVAMPFRKDMEDVFYYGIQRAAHVNNLLCERIDQDAFTGDILDRIKKKIETAAVVIAELSGANPNVYLEVGYAWGKEVPTILLAKKSEDLRFDVSGQRCLKYEIIKELEEELTKELNGLLLKK